MADDVTLKAVLIGEDRSLSKTMGKAGDSVDQVGKKSKLTGAAMKGALSAAVRETLGVETELSTTGGTSDGRFIAEICAEVVEFGPVNASIHKIDEHIATDAIEPLSVVYERTLTALLAPGPL